MILTTLLIPKYSICLSKVRIVVKTSQLPPGVKISQDPVFPGVYAYTPYPDSQGGGLFGKKNSVT